MWPELISKYLMHFFEGAAPATPPSTSTSDSSTNPHFNAQKRRENNQSVASASALFPRWRSLSITKASAFTTATESDSLERPRAPQRASTITCMQNAQARSASVYAN
ncbi:hypothetical protein HKX48_003194, partial [Thoreauomyces humboldtii]